ncbi:hypothetical protein C2845_PM09G18860 [Panicum miliaceum]|uniref:Uncharacterized protein n=1 Tax=Panicum miliaceum TaxID=4540 RepID=A0A3L6RXH0_PANMI|nr:hypothetical protein C2845_PM09G18860 [Panicum miliaceum]
MVTHVASSSFYQVKRYLGLDKLRSKLRDVIKSITRVRACAEMFVKVMAVESTESIHQSLECLPIRATGSLLHEDSIFGRKEDVDELVALLLNESDLSSPDGRGSSSIEVHTVVGIGGIGKTTVAQLIYNDRRIADTFDLRMWVCVSRNFDKVNLIKQIIAHAAGGENIELTNANFNMLQEDLQRRISGKRFLLVLDDVWYNENSGVHINQQSWRELIAPLKKALPGSKILVTTRMELVAKILESRSSHSLPGIGQDASWLLFKDRIDFHLGPELKKIGEQIVQKLNGLPLALKVVAGHLCGKYRVAEWNEFLHNDTLNNLNDMLAILRLSYGSLPVHLQHCFAYCSLFPKGYHIDPNRLIHMWIAQGFVDINGRTNMTLEEAGRSCFNELLARSFFQILIRDGQTFYIMHDAMSDLALHVSEGECLRVERESTEEILLPVYTRHVSIYSEKTGILEKCDLKALRSLIVLSRSWFCSKVCLNHDILDKLKSVRVLDISGCCLERLPKSVNKLIHLRYLGIKRTYFPLPKKTSLYHLQTLFVQYHSCCSSRELTTSGGKAKTVGGHFHLPVKSFSKLINLMHIDIEKAYVLMLSSTQKLASVECSGEYHVDEEEGSLVGLRDLNKLRGQLIIKSLDKVKSREGAANAHLDQKKDITKLELHWGSYQCDNATTLATRQYHMVPGFMGYFQCVSGTFSTKRYPVVRAVRGSFSA